MAQVFAEMTKDFGLVPVMVSDVRLTAAVPVFFTVTVWAADVAPTAVDGNARLAGATDTAKVEAAVEVPASATN